MKNKLDATVDTLVSMQLINYIIDIEVDTPANTQIWFNQLRKLFNFEDANVEGVVKLVDSDFDLKKFMKMKSEKVPIQEDD